MVSRKKSFAENVCEIVGHEYRFSGAACGRCNKYEAEDHIEKIIKVLSEGYEDGFYFRTRLLYELNRLIEQELIHEFNFEVTKNSSDQRVVVIVLRFSQWLGKTTLKYVLQ